MNTSWDQYKDAAEAAAARGDYATAESLWTQLLAAADAAGHHDARFALGLDSLGKVYAAQKRFPQAEAAYAKSIQVKEALFGNMSIEVAKTCNFLAALCYEQNKFEKTESLGTRALKIYQSLLGNDHPAVATMANNLARLQQKINNPAPVMAQAQPQSSAYASPPQPQYAQQHSQAAVAVSNPPVQGTLHAGGSSISQPQQNQSQLEPQGLTAAQQFAQYQAQQQALQLQQQQQQLQQQQQQLALQQQQLRQQQLQQQQLQQEQLRQEQLRQEQLRAQQQQQQQQQLQQAQQTAPYGGGQAQSNPQYAQQAMSGSYGQSQQANLQNQAPNQSSNPGYNQQQIQAIQQAKAAQQAAFQAQQSQSQQAHSLQSQQNQQQQPPQPQASPPVYSAPPQQYQQPVYQSPPQQPSYNQAPPAQAPQSPKIPPSANAPIAGPGGLPDTAAEKPAPKPPTPTQARVIEERKAKQAEQVCEVCGRFYSGPGCMQCTQSLTPIDFGFDSLNPKRKDQR